MDDLSLQTALEAILCDARGEAHLSTPHEVRRKALQDYVTDVDLRLDTYLTEKLFSLTPGVPVLSEERAVEDTGIHDRYWIIDPIDGTMNLMCKLPFVAISVALVDKDGPRIAGVISLVDGVVYSAARGFGARRDGVALDLTASPPSELITLSTGMLDALVAGYPGAYRALRQVGKIRNMGAQSLNLCLVALGGLAAVTSLEAKVWDEAAGGLIVREAGGVWDSAADRADWRSPSQMMALKGQNSLACHPAVAEKLRPVLAPLLGS